LETRGLIEQRTSVADGREKKLFATETGQKLLAEIRSMSVKRQEELFAPLTVSEREIFFELALKIASEPSLLQTATMRPDKDLVERNEHETS
jgi:DNA-binding MarR family transcriptional regulator